MIFIWIWELLFIDFSDGRSKKKSSLCCCGKKTGAESEDEEVGADSFLQENVDDGDIDTDSESSRVKIS